MQQKNKIAVFGSMSVLVAVSLLAAMSIVCGKYLAFGVGQVLRFSFENLPVMLAGIMFGPVAGLVTGVVADLVGSMMVGYAINPIITVGAGAIGALSGIMYRLVKKSPIPALALAVAVSHLVGSVVIKTFGLSAFYDMPFLLLMAWRALNYAIVGSVEFALICVIMKNKAVSTMLARLKRGNL